MIIEDRIWGTFNLCEPVFDELIQLKEMQRLRGISQFGLPYKYYPIVQYTRFEHSVGVMVLLRKLGAGLEEQVAGLLHDVSHTAFSHLVDWAIGDRENENYQDLRHRKIICNGKISKTLRKHGFSSERISDYEKFTLLEQPSPELCADRVDYATREFRDWSNPPLVDLCKENLIRYNGSMVFRDKESAGAFSYEFLRLQREHWGGAEWMLRYQIFSDILKDALKKQIICVDDFSRDDNLILGKLENCDDNKIRSRLEKLSGRISFEFEEKNPDYVLHKKFRHVDPLFYDGKNLARLSEVDNSFREYLARERDFNARGVSIILQ